VCPWASQRSHRSHPPAGQRYTSIGLIGVGLYWREYHKTAAHQTRVISADRAMSTFRIVFVLIVFLLDRVAVVIFITPGGRKHQA
jgi:hypothetical protein